MIKKKRDKIEKEPVLGSFTINPNEDNDADVDLDDFLNKSSRRSSRSILDEGNSK